MWDYKHEYTGKIVTLRDVPALFTRKTFSCVYRPQKWGTSFLEFDALAYLLGHVGEDFTLCVDEVTTACDGTKEGGLGHLIRFSRQQSINIVWATQRPFKIPGVCLSEVNVLHVFHLHHYLDLSPLKTVLAEEQLRRVAALPPHEHITVNNL